MNGTAYQVSCGSLAPLASRAACEAMNRPHKQARHLERMERCQLRPASLHVWQVGTSAAQTLLNQKAYVDGGRVNSGTGGVLLHTCEVDEPGGTWLFTRIGPFETRGGSSWSRLLATFNTSLSARFEDHAGNILIGDHILGNVAADGGILPYPPIHQHHYHLIFGSNMWRQAINVHGDSECFGNQREYCLLREYPEGLAFYTRQQLGICEQLHPRSPAELQASRRAALATLATLLAPKIAAPHHITPCRATGADFNDVRPAGSAPLTSYVFAGLRLLRPTRYAQPAPRPLRHSYMMIHPFLGELLGARNGPFSTFIVNSSKESVMWSTGLVPDVDYVSRSARLEPWTVSVVDGFSRGRASPSLASNRLRGLLTAADWELDSKLDSNPGRAARPCLTRADMDACSAPRSTGRRLLLPLAPRDAG